MQKRKTQETDARDRRKRQTQETDAEEIDVKVKKKKQINKKGVCEKENRGCKK